MPVLSSICEKIRDCATTNVIARLPRSQTKVDTTIPPNTTPKLLASIVKPPAPLSPLAANGVLRADTKLWPDPYRRFHGAHPLDQHPPELLVLYTSGKSRPRYRCRSPLSNLWLLHPWPISGHFVLDLRPLKPLHQTPLSDQVHRRTQRATPALQRPITIRFGPSLWLNVV